MIKQDFNKLKDFFENYDENNMRSKKFRTIDFHMEHYRKRLVSNDVLFKSFQNLNILDVGCGEGKTTK